jgi:hypothetical protein
MMRGNWSKSPGAERLSDDEMNRMFVGGWSKCPLPISLVDVMSRSFQISESQSHEQMTVHEKGRTDHMGQRDLERSTTITWNHAVKQKSQSNELWRAIARNIGIRG